MKQDATPAPAAEASTPSRGYLLCSIERTGSSLLGDTLWRTRIAGNPIEYFNPVMAKRPRLLGILGESSLVDGFSKVLAAGATPNGVFGAKVHWEHFLQFGRLLSGEAKPRASMPDLLSPRRGKLISLAEAESLLNAYFPDMRAHAAAYRFVNSRVPDLRIVWLRRRNMAARALSLFRARQTGVWYRGLAKPGEPQAEPAPEFDLAEIHRLNCLGVFQENRWRRFFEEHAIAPLTLTYEELIADLEPTVRRVLEFLEVDGDGVAIAPPGSRKQADALSAEWEERYREALAETET